MTNSLPPSASVAHVSEGAKLYAPSAGRNAEIIATLVASVAPQVGEALEIASGTGQHMVHLATHCAGLMWQPTDIESARLDSINAYVAEAGLRNVAPANFLDATRPGWGNGRYSVVVLVNLLHLIPEKAARTVLVEAAQALTPTGTVVLYGPFLRNGLLTSKGDARFDAELRAADPMIGYKNDQWVVETLQNSGLKVQTRQMPANNLALIARRS